MYVSSTVLRRTRIRNRRPVAVLAAVDQRSSCGGVVYGCGGGGGGGRRRRRHRAAAGPVVPAGLVIRPVSSAALVRTRARYDNGVPVGRRRRRPRPLNIAFVEFRVR